MNWSWIVRKQKKKSLKYSLCWRCANCGALEREEVEATERILPYYNKLHDCAPNVWGRSQLIEVGREELEKEVIKDARTRPDSR